MSMSFETIRACIKLPKRRLRGARVGNFQVAFGPAMVAPGGYEDDVVGHRLEVAENLANGCPPDAAVAGVA
jgi:hypothetical protein